MKKRTLLLIAALICFVVFAAFTVAVKKVDVQNVGADMTDIGFAGFNVSMRDSIGTSESMDKLSTVLMLLGFGAAFVFFMMWLVQIFKYRTFTAPLDGELYLLGLTYFALLVLYVLFEKLEINFRPILDEAGKPEASYPSSHVMFSVTMLGIATLYIRNRLLSRTFRVSVSAAGSVLCAAAVVTRTLSGKHWMTDIIAAVILSASLVLAYEGLACNCKCRKVHPRGTNPGEVPVDRVDYGDPFIRQKNELDRQADEYMGRPVRRNAYTPAEKDD